MHLYRRTEPTPGGLGEILLTAIIEPDAQLTSSAALVYFPPQPWN
jgi:hypothetical protein